VAITATAQQLAEIPCLVCGSGPLEAEYRLVAKPPGTYSLAGVQPKVAATERLFVVCRACEACGLAERVSV
jgi:hypothetical protein